jgi:cyclopropane-fatty-acyl-phospholipid synthase
MLGGRNRNVASQAAGTLRRLADGRFARLPVAVRFWDGSVLSGRRRSGDPVVCADRRAVAHLLRAPGQIGLARAFVDGSLRVEADLEEVLAARGAFQGIRLSISDRARLALGAIRIAGPAVLRRPPIPEIEAAVSGDRHSLSRDRVAVRHHYDLSNDFYRLVLGPSMVYSCAYFAEREDTLEEAQERKLDLICRKLRLTAGERFLDIGCGWGSLVLHAAGNYGVRAVGVTLSEPQAELARALVRHQGLQDRVEIRIADYRELTDGPFDKIASVGMYEHVGRSELGRYVGTIAALLRPGGLFLNHGIARLASERPTSETFVSRYIFPDGELHPVTDLMAEMRPAALEVRDVESLRDHYPLTLRRWAANLREHRAEAAAIVGSERVRAWQLYMLASAQGFEQGEITIYHVLAALYDSPLGLPLDRSKLLSRVDSASAARAASASASSAGRER